MRVSAFVLTLAFGALQSVALTDCCCIAECALAKKETAVCETVARAEEPAGCCEGKTPASSPVRCTHIQPTQEVDSHAQPVLHAPSTAVLLPVVDLLPPLRLDSVVDPVGFPRPARGRPLFLLHSSFLI